MCGIRLYTVFRSCLLYYNFYNFLGIQDFELLKYNSIKALGNITTNVTGKMKYKTRRFITRLILDYQTLKNNLPSGQGEECIVSVHPVALDRNVLEEVCHGLLVGVVRLHQRRHDGACTFPERVNKY